MAELPPPVQCKRCPAKFRWFEKMRGGHIPLELEPDHHGAWVVREDDVSNSGWVAVPYQVLLHPAQDRYRSHLDRCRPVREEGPPMPALQPKPDPTAGLKFPRRRTRKRAWGRTTGPDQVDEFVRTLCDRRPSQGVGPFPPLEQLIREAVLPHTSCIRRDDGPTLAEEVERLRYERDELRELRHHLKSETAVYPADLARRGITLPPEAP